MIVFPPLLTPLYWERPGNIPPLTRLLQVRLALRAAPNSLL